MGVLIFPGIRSRQPTQPSVINRNHPLAQGLAFFVAPYGGPQLYDYVQGRIATPSRAQPTQVTQSTTQGSLASTFASASSDLQTLPDLAAYNILGKITLLWGGTITTGSAYRAFCSKITAGGSGAVDCPFDFRTNNAATPVAVLVRANASVNSSVIANNTISLGVYHQVGVVTDQVNVARFFIDGVVDVNSSTLSLTPTAVASNLNIGRRQDGAVQMNGSFEFVCAWSRALADAEIKEMYRNPWQMFRRTPLLLVPSPAATVLNRRTLGQRVGSRGA